MISDAFWVNQDGRLTVGGCDTLALAREYGTPLYVMDESQIRVNCRNFLNAAYNGYDGESLPIFAGKSFLCKEMCRVIASEGFGLDVVSGGELYTAAAADFPREKIFFHGNNKSDAELTLALEENIGRIVVDNLPELRRLSSLAMSKNKTADILFRLKPGVDAHTHDFISTGQIDSKFGFAIETGEAFEAARTAAELPYINLCGIHCHIGSQIFEPEPYATATKVMLEFMLRVKKELGISFSDLNMGGGFGIKYKKSDTPPPFAAFLEAISETTRDFCDTHTLSLPRLLIEPGRSIAAPAGLTLYTVGSVKEIPGKRTYVIIDGGMADNPRYALYGAPYTVMAAQKANHPATQTVTLAGKCCESGDLIQEHTLLQAVAPGDLIAVLATGAYNYSMSSNYNRLPRPPVVMVENGKSRVIVRGETFEDIIRNDI
ncbi:MAG: diaminopimelate decarboxylase [Oscillospiraceae bacterium]|jgi:diaminopimelate decarboxylase|nr:diaminopimelate decarboxylase [Oscillospiraceae bacterium]